MRNTLKISLKPNEKIYLNGAVVRVDRKVTLELLNDVQFLLESHVLQMDEATTPLRQLYFILQAILMDPQNAEPTLVLFYEVLASAVASFSNETVLEGLKAARQMAGAKRIFEAMRTIRGLFPVEAAILAGGASKPPRAA